jgi:hypothetical protein
MAIPKVVQAYTVNGGSSVASQSVTLTAGNTPGNVMVMGWRPTGGAVTVSDSSGNVWTTVVTGNLGFAYAPITVPSGPSGATGNPQNIVTWHSSPNSFPRFILLELYGGVIGATGWTQPSSNTSLATTVTPNSGSISDLTTDILIGVCANNTDTTALTTSWTSFGYSVTVNDPGMFFLAPTGTDSFSGTSLSANWGMGIFNLRPTFATGGGGGQYISC